jgi:hypothetical protein
MKRSHWKTGTLALLLMAAATPTFAAVLKDPKPTLTGRSDEARQNDAAFDAQYRALRSNDGDSGPKADPWGNVRTLPTQPAPAHKKPKN